MKLSRQGYGSLDEVRGYDARKFMNLIHYENYLDKYHAVATELNKKK